MFRKDQNSPPSPPFPATKLKRWTDEDNNPCKIEANASYQCLHDNNFDRKKCEGAFINYRNCQKFWNNIKKERRKQGISPAMPSEKERAEILRSMQTDSASTWEKKKKLRRGVRNAVKTWTIKWEYSSLIILIHSAKKVILMIVCFFHGTLSTGQTEVSKWLSIKKRIKESLSCNGKQQENGVGMP